MVTEEEWHGEMAKAKRLRFVSPLAGLVVLGLLTVPAVAIGRSYGSGATGYLVTAAVLCAILLPLIFLLVIISDRQQKKTDDKVQALTRELSEAIEAADREGITREVQGQRQRFESRLANALDMAEGEPEVIDVIERSFAAVVPDAPVELLLADNSHAHLLRMAGVGPDGELPSCSVDSPDRCPAARRAQVQVFGDSDHLDACPKLRNRPQGRLSALCVPVSIMGRTVGVIHATDKPEAVVEDSQVQDLTTLAKLAGARIGLLRVMAETQLQASTDTLTGLMNRRSFSEKVAAIPHDLHPVALAMADLDHFKNLNDTYGHETGDRALRLFARVLRDALRGHDLISRYGGEEFAIAFPDCSAVDATRALTTVQAQLDAAITVGGLPKFTSSFGITEIEPGEELAAVLRRADDALLLAKRSGRNQIVLHDPGTASNAPETNGNSSHAAEDLVRIERI
ncbi:MAG TPA: sensor domain-containing diguanylate cyclase [Acidimicrobiales bacterium]|jgi:diguanylate cyclase (GGDEF)-like protein|nr:sensor domain-containing diguanylate cyclase [Acidimicrobiales bacterium]